MALKIRLWQQGCRNKLCYRVVVTNSQAPRDGKYIESLGWYNPEGKTPEQKRSVRADRLVHWLSVGAKMSTTVAAVAKKAVPEAMKEYAMSLEAKLVQKAAKRRE